jgi:hypothetical protein
VPEAVPIQHSSHGGFDESVLRFRADDHFNECVWVEREFRVRREDRRTTLAELHIHGGQLPLSEVGPGFADSPQSSELGEAPAAVVFGDGDAVFLFMFEVGVLYERELVQERVLLHDAAAYLPVK